MVHQKKSCAPKGPKGPDRDSKLLRGGFEMAAGHPINASGQFRIVKIYWQ